MPRVGRKKRTYGVPVRPEKHADGTITWRYDVWLPKEGSQELRRLRGKGLPSEAEAWARVNKLRERAARNDIGQILAPTLGDLIAVRLHAIPQGREHTRAKRVLTTWRDMLPAHLLVAEIEAAHIRLYVARREKDGQAASSINRELNIIASTLHQVADFFPSLAQWRCPRIPRPKVAQSRRERIITEDESGRLLAYLMRPADELDGKRPQDRANAYHARVRVAQIVRFALLTAARHSEIVGLRWRDIDTERGRILIYQTKTGRYKEIPLIPAIIDLLEERRAVSHHEFIFTEGGNIYPKFYRILREACAALKIPYGKNTPGGLVLHAARHTVTTRLVEAGLDFDTIGQITGHRSKELIAHYAHRTPESMKRAANALQNLANRHLIDTDEKEPK